MRRKYHCMMQVLGRTVNGTTYAGIRARTTGAPQNHWFGPAGDPRQAQSDLNIASEEPLQATRRPSLLKCFIECSPHINLPGKETPPGGISVARLVRRAPSPGDEPQPGDFSLLEQLLSIAACRSAGIGTPEAIRLVWSCHREVINDYGPAPTDTSVMKTT